MYQGKIYITRWHTSIRWKIRKPLWEYEWATGKLVGNRLQKARVSVCTTRMYKHMTECAHNAHTHAAQTLPGHLGVTLWGRILSVYFPPRRIFRLASLSRQFRADAVPRALWKVTEWVFARPVAYLSNSLATAAAADKWALNAPMLASRLPFLTKIEFYHAANFVTDQVVVLIVLGNYFPILHARSKLTKVHLNHNANQVP